MSPDDAQMDDVTAVIAAAGSGERLGAGGPKALVPLAGRPLYAWSAAAFDEAGVAAVVIACPPGLTAQFEVGVAVEGGATRAVSVANALARVETGLVAIHDAARPLLTPGLIEGVVGALRDAGPDAAAAILAAPVTDTIKLASPDRVVSSDRDRERDSPLEVERTLDRGRLWAAQTPQVFRTEALREAIAAAPEGAAATDEAMLVEAAGGRVVIHPGPAENLKVTTRLDLELAGRLLEGRD